MFGKLSVITFCMKSMNSIFFQNDRYRWYVASSCACLFFASFSVPSYKTQKKLCILKLSYISSALLLTANDASFRVVGSKYSKCLKQLAVHNKMMNTHAFHKLEYALLIWKKPTRRQTRGDKCMLNIYIFLLCAAMGGALIFLEHMFSFDRPIYV